LCAQCSLAPQLRQLGDIHRNSGWLVSRLAEIATIDNGAGILIMRWVLLLGGLPMAKKRKAKKAAAKKTTKRRRSYDSQSGRLTGREVGAQARLEKLAEQYMAQDNMDAASARQRAREVMRANPRKDWRA
jgi:hypothetical protein